MKKTEPYILLAEKERSLFALAMKTSAVEVKPVKFQKTMDHDAEVNLLFLSELSTASSHRVKNQLLGRDATVHPETFLLMSGIQRERGSSCDSHKIQSEMLLNEQKDSV